VESCHTAKNGIKIYGYRNPSQNGFFISLFLRAGSMYESASENGITHLLEHVSIRNVNKVMGGHLYRDLDRLGLEFNAATYSEMVQFYLSGASKNFGAGAEIISKLLSPIILDAGEIDVERKRIKAEIREGDEKNSLLSFTNKIVNEGTSLSASITGTAATVTKISRRRLEEYRKSLFTRERAFLYVTGAYTDEDIAALSDFIGAYPLLESKSECFNVAPVSENHFKRSGEVFVKKSDFTAVRFNFDIDMTRVSTPESDLIYDMLFSGYSSAFFQAMSEERGIIYDITGSVERYKNIGALYFSYEVQNKDLEESIRIALEILRDFKATRPAPGSLMKSGYVDNALMLLDDSRELNFTLAYDNHIMGLGYKSIEERRRAYDSVTPTDIERAAGEIFKPKNLVLTIKGDKKKINTEKISEMIQNILG